MKALILLTLVLPFHSLLASCIESSDPCNDVIVIEQNKTKKETPSKELSKEFHWSDEKDPEEREWLKKEWSEEKRK